MTTGQATFKCNECNCEFIEMLNTEDIECPNCKSKNVECIDIAY